MACQIQVEIGTGQPGGVNNVYGAYNSDPGTTVPSPFNVPQTQSTAIGL